MFACFDEVKHDHFDIERPIYPAFLTQATGLNKNFSYLGKILRVLIFPGLYAIAPEMYTPPGDIHLSYCGYTLWPESCKRLASPGPTIYLLLLKACIGYLLRFVFSRQTQCRAAGLERYDLYPYHAPRYMRAM